MHDVGVGAIRQRQIGKGGGEDGERLYYMEVKRIIPKAINSSEFELPDSYIDGQKALQESFKIKE